MNQTARRATALFPLFCALALSILSACRDLIGPQDALSGFIEWRGTVVDLDGKSIPACRVTVEEMPNQESNLDFREYYDADESGRVRLVVPDQSQVLVWLEPRDDRPNYPLRLPDPQSSPPELVYGRVPMQRFVDLGPISPSTVVDSHVGLTMKRSVADGVDINIFEFLSLSAEGTINFWGADDFLLDRYTVSINLEAMRIEWREDDLAVAVRDAVLHLPPLAAAEVEIIATGTAFPHVPGAVEFRAGSGNYTVRSGTLDLQSSQVTLLAPIGAGQLSVDALGSELVLPHRVEELVWTEGANHVFEYAPYRITARLFDAMGTPLAFQPVQVFGQWTSQQDFRADAQGVAIFYAQPADYLLVVLDPVDRSIQKMVPLNVASDMDVLIQLDAPG
jgi:hypothetical protein